MLFLYNLQNLYCENVLYLALCALGWFLIVSLVLVFLQTNPVYAVFSFIITALLAFGFFICVGAEFFAILILIIYIGVITVLFLFVVIMYNLRSITFSVDSIWHTPFVYLWLYKILWFNSICAQHFNILINQNPYINVVVFTTDIANIAFLFNTQYLLFFLCGLIIFIAMLGSVVMTSPFYKHFR